jgi:class 3 adenylate cyclase
MILRFGGREIDSAGDGFFATFDRPAEAVRCACSISDAILDVGVEIRVNPNHEARRRIRRPSRSHSPRGETGTPV